MGLWLHASPLPVVSAYSGSLLLLETHFDRETLLIGQRNSKALSDELCPFGRPDIRSKQNPKGLRTHRQRPWVVHHEVRQLPDQHIAETDPTNERAARASRKTRTMQQHRNNNETATAQQLLLQPTPQTRNSTSKIVRKRKKAASSAAAAASAQQPTQQQWQQLTSRTAPVNLLLLSNAQQQANR